MAKRQTLGMLCKERMIEELLSRFKEHPDFFIMDYMGSTVSDLEAVRRSLRTNASTFFVVKNSVIKIVFEKLKVGGVEPLVSSGMGFALSGGDIIATCKALVHFAKGHDKFKIRGAFIDGKLITVDRVKTLASIPPKEVLLAQVLCAMNAPITSFVYVLSGVMRKFVYCVDAIRENKKKEQLPASPQDAPAGA